MWKYKIVEAEGNFWTLPWLDVDLSRMMFAWLGAALDFERIQKKLAIKPVSVLCEYGWMNNWTNFDTDLFVEKLSR